MNMSSLRGIILFILGIILLSFYPAQARRIKDYTILQQLIQDGESTIQASDGAVFTFKLEEYPQDDRFLGQRYVVSVLTEDGIEIAHRCFRVHGEWAYGYEDFRSNDAFYYKNTDTGYIEWLTMADGRNPGPALMVRKDYRIKYKGIGTTLASIGLQLARILGAKYFDAVNVLNPGFHQAMGYQLIPRQGIGGSVNMSFDLSDPNAVFPPIVIIRRP